jgi:hypothetical protein
MFTKFWAWYNRHYKIQLRIATVLFILQLVHLIWMTTNVVLFRLAGTSVFPEFLNPFLALVDYTEIPALISVTFVYINDIMLGHKTRKAWWFILLLNTQWIHLLWITDEIIYASFVGKIPVPIPAWLSWIAILIDYLEIPVMYDTIKRSFFRP